ncbi:MAG TPA: universal stress protein [Lacipirellulaceae bacterium]|nr:universal stress protein [Lacipirellulaceae bacterium]
MKHLLVATDFSDMAAAALRQAIHLAEMSGAKITLLHVVHADKVNETLLGLDAMEYRMRSADAEWTYHFGDGLQRLRDASREALQETIAALPEPRPTIEPVVIDGRPSQEIVNYANANHVDLIVVGTHGRGALGKAFLGSVADNLIRQADCPVMVVRK